MGLWTSLFLLVWWSSTLRSWLLQEAEWTELNCVLFAYVTSPWHLVPSVQFSCSVVSDSLRPHESQQLPELSWLSGSWRSFLYSSSVYTCHLSWISSASVRPIPFLSFLEPIFAWNALSPLICSRQRPVSLCPTPPPVLWNLPYRCVHVHVITLLSEQCCPTELSEMMGIPCLCTV